MIDLGPSCSCPPTVCPIAGRARIATVLDNTATLLEHLLSETLAMMNAGATLDEIVHTVRVPDDLADLPYLRATYDEPEFVVRNIWRLYGGWYDGNPARLKPPADADSPPRSRRWPGERTPSPTGPVRVAAGGDLRLACQLAEWAAGAGDAPRCTRPGPRSTGCGGPTSCR